MKIVLALFVLLFTISCSYDDSIDRMVFNYEIGMEAFHGGKYKKRQFILKKLATTIEMPRVVPIWPFYTKRVKA